MASYFSDGLSVDETRVSSLIAMFILTVFIALYQAIWIGDISDNLLMLLGYEIGAITGINIAETVGKVTTNKKIQVENTVEDTSVQNLP